MIKTVESPSYYKFSNTIDSTSKQDLVSFPKVPYFKFYGRTLTVYSEYPFQQFRPARHPNSMKNLEKKKFQGNMSRATAKYLQRKIDTWISSINEYNTQSCLKPYQYPNRPIFITLTLPSDQLHSDKEFKRLIFDVFIKWLQRQTGSHLYFWRAEPQKNGRIHFHVIHDTYIDKIILQTYWNNLLSKHGYNSVNKYKYTSGQAPSTKIQLLDNPDITTAYILKYATKTSTGRKIEGRIWGMADDLRKIEPYSAMLSDGIQEDLLELIKSGACTHYQKEFRSVITIKDEKKTEHLLTDLYSDRRKHFMTVYDYLYFGYPEVLLPPPDVKLYIPESPSPDPEKPFQFELPLIDKYGCSIKNVSK